MADSTIQFSDLTTNKFILNALEDLNFSTPTEIQAKAIKPVGSGKDVVGIAQTGTGKTFAYLLPILQNLKFSKQDSARVLILVPTRELVVQVEEEAKKLAKYLNHRIIGVYGGVNINTQKEKFSNGADVIIGSQGFNLNTWTHFSLVRSSNTVTMYVAGQNVGSATVANDLGISGSSSNSALITASSSLTTSEINLQNASFSCGLSSLK